MVILRFRTSSDAKDVLKKLKKMHKFIKELIECVEDQYDDEDEDEDFEYREESYMTHPSYRGGSRMGGSRYRRGM
jgi:hypothetical protein